MKRDKKDEAEKDKLLVRYLLGSLSEEEQLQVEAMFLNNYRYYERLLALENELFYDYAQGRLSPEERKQFEEQFLTPARNRRRIQIASALANKLPEAASFATIEIDLANRKPRWRQTLLSYLGLQSTLNGRNVAVRFSLTALVIVSLGFGWLLLERARLRTEFDRFRAEQTAQEELLQQQARQEQVRAGDLDLRLKRELGKNAIFRRELNRMEAQSYLWRRYSRTMISLPLAPSSAGGEANNLKMIYLPARTRLLKLRLNLKKAVENSPYQAILLTAGGDERWRRAMLKARPTRSGRVIVLRLPARLLKEGDYELRLKNRASDPTLEGAEAYYYFSIIK